MLVRALPDGQFDVSEGKVDISYKLDGPSRVYRVMLKNLIRVLA